MTTTQKTALVLGATGGIGGETARILRARGWSVRALHRNPATVETPGGLDWRQGDAMSPADVTAAAEGADLIVHAVNPPGYRDWDRLVLPMLDSTLAAAKHSGARILLPGTIYNYGPDAWPILSETSPQHPASRKGKIRVEMETRLARAADAGAEVIVVRAGDYFGPRVANSWFAQGLVRPGKAAAGIGIPSPRGVGHQWAYLPDVAETMVRLVERNAPEGFAAYHMAGHWDPDGTAMIGAIRRELGKPDLAARRFPWALAWAAAPFVTMLRELLEMRPLWDNPIRMTNAKLTATIGAEPHTPLDAAVRTTLIGLGCLSAPEPEATHTPGVRIS